MSGVDLLNVDLDLSLVCVVTPSSPEPRWMLQRREGHGRRTLRHLTPDHALEIATLLGEEQVVLDALTRQAAWLAQQADAARDRAFTETQRRQVEMLDARRRASVAQQTARRLVP